MLCLGRVVISLTIAINLNIEESNGLNGHEQEVIIVEESLYPLQSETSTSNLQAPNKDEGL